MQTRENVVQSLTNFRLFGVEQAQDVPVEGGAFIGGFGMSADHRLKTAAGLSGLWDGDPKRVRAGEGVTILAGRRLSLHLMVQPEVADQLIGENRIWTILRARLLKNQSSSHDHEIPLTGRMIEMLIRAQDQKVGRLVFPGRRGKPLSENAFTKLLQELTGQGYTAHGFRSTFKDWARGSGMPDADQISEIQLDHVEPN